MRIITAVLLLLVGLNGFACRRQEFRTVTLVCPQVQNAACTALVTAVLDKTEGVVSNSVKCGVGTVTVTYDSMRTAIKNLEFAVAEVGFDAGPIPADAKARDALPAECKQAEPKPNER
jgi:MprA protease rhombosortase-interaction domain-containing protein